MNIKEYLCATASLIIDNEEASETDKDLAIKVRVALETQHTKGNDLVLVLYETASAGGYLTDKVKLIKKDQIVQMAGNPHLDLVAEEWDHQARKVAWQVAEEEPDDVREHCYQRLRFDPDIGLSHLIYSEYTERLCSALSSVAANLLQPVRWRYNREACLSSAVFSCQPQERIYRLLTRHLKTELHWKSRAIRSELVTRKPYWPSCAPIYDERDLYLSQYTSQVRLYSNLQFYRRIKDIQKEIGAPAGNQEKAGAGIDLSLLHEPNDLGHGPLDVDFRSLLDDDGDLPF